MQRVKVIGLKKFKGVVDGNAIDSGKLFIEVKLDGSRNGPNQFGGGMCAEEVRLPSSEFAARFEHMAHLLPPNGPGFYVDLDTERVSNGKVARDVVVDARPVEIAKAIKAA